MALFIKILLTMFIAEMGDKTQLLLVAMTSRFKLRDIILGSAAAILVLNGLAVGVGSLISRLIPGYLIKIIAALAFFFFAWSSLSGDGGEEEAGSHKESRLPALTVFATFFVAELGDKTQLTAITFAANEGLSHAVTIWLACSLGLFAAGAAAALMLGNFFLVPVLAAGLMLLPFWYVRLSATHYKRDVADELETSLSVITTAYLRTEDIITAVEENLPYLDQPVYQVFQSFLARYVDADLNAALTELRGRIQNDVFAEWCDSVIACQQDRNLKSTLPAILAKLSDTRTVNAELDTMMAEPRKEFFTMVVLVMGIIPLLRALNEDWYRILMHTPLGQLILAICAGAIFVSTAAVIRLTQPIEYRR